MRLRLVGAALLALAAVPVLGTSAQAAEPAASTAAVPFGWEASHGAATASGTAIGSVTGVTLRTLRVQGTLTNTGADCVSTWVFPMHDLSVFPAKQAEQCGPGSVRIDETYTLMPTSSVSIQVCVGEGRADCSPLVRL